MIGSMGGISRVSAFNFPCLRDIRGRLMAETASPLIVGDASLWLLLTQFAKFSDS